MRTLCRTAGLALACMAATGCISTVTLIKLKPDGSGTIEQTMSMNAAVAKELSEMIKGFAEAGDQKGPASAELFSEAELKAAALKMGEGVRFESSTPIKTADRTGRKAVYSFRDITKIRLDQKPKLPGPVEQQAKGPGPENVSFRFVKQPAGTSVLTIAFPEPDVSAAKDDDDPAETPSGDGEKPSPEQLEMMKQMFDGLKIEMALEVLGTIVKTNSPYVDGSKVTLLEIDFVKLLENEKLMTDMGQPKSMAEAKKVLQGIEGFKVNLDREVTVEFK